MKRVSAACNGKVRVRGRGNGYVELSCNSDADLPMQVALSCANAVELEIGRSMLAELLNDIAEFFQISYSTTHKLSKFYTVVEHL